MPFELPPLPWPDDALDPSMTAKTLSFHHGKHFATYIAKLNDAIEGTPLAEKTLDEIVCETAGDPAKKGVFNNAAQVWNHAFFWNSMKPGGGGKPEGKLLERIEASFGSFDAFREQFANTAATHFGSGWIWLVANGDALEIVTTSNAETPLTSGKTPLLTLDVWEHAYYLDYQNRRPDFIASFLDGLANWDFAAANLAG